MKKVCLEGTTKMGWRDELKSILKIDTVDPSVLCSGACDFRLFVIDDTDNLFVNAVKTYSVNPDKTVICVLKKEPESPYTIADMLEDNDIRVFRSIQDAADALNKHYIEIPLNPNVIECLIKRDGPTQMKLGGFTYTFEKNELGNYVCEVLSGDHRKYLLSLPDFRIYQEHLLPVPEFSKEEEDCIREWQYLGKDNFLAYVNGRIAELGRMSNKLRIRLNEKWKAVIPKTINEITGKETQQECPIHIDPPEMLSNEEQPEDEFINEWCRLTGERFKEYIKKNEQRFLDCSDDTYDKAEAKWKKLMPDEPWPFDEE